LCKNQYQRSVYAVAPPAPAACTTKSACVRPAAVTSESRSRQRNAKRKQIVLCRGCDHTAALRRSALCRPRVGPLTPWTEWTAAPEQPSHLTGRRRPISTPSTYLTTTPFSARECVSCNYFESGPFDLSIFCLIASAN
jgi:hypothetical protein